MSRETLTLKTVAGPNTFDRIMSTTVPTEIIWTFAAAPGRQVLAPFDATFLKLMWSSATDAEPAAVKMSAEASQVALANADAFTPPFIKGNENIARMTARLRGGNNSGRVAQIGYVADVTAA